MFGSLWVWELNYVGGLDGETVQELFIRVSVTELSRCPLYRRVKFDKGAACFRGRAYLYSNRSCSFYSILWIRNWLNDLVVFIGSANWSAV